MKQLKVHTLLSIAEDLCAATHALEGWENHGVSDDNKRAILSHLKDVETLADPLGLRTVSRQVARTKDCLERSDCDYGALKEKVSELRLRIQDELEGRHFLWVEKSDFYRASREKFGEKVESKFPSTKVEIEEAGKCLALERNTACVFHLMRVMELGLRALGRSLKDPNLDPKRNPSWERILNRCDEQLRKPIRDRSPEWRKDHHFFSEATANLRAVKDAWRNPTMHVEIHYDSGQAEDVFNAVKSFMRHLATKLSEH